MKTGIYLSGLGKTVDRNSVEKYAARFRNEMNFNTNGLRYETKTEKISYCPGRESLVVSIYEKNTPNDPVYQFYDFRYHEILTEKFTGRSLLFKSFRLLILVLGKFPLIIKRIFFPSAYSRPFQLFYIFSIFLTLSFSLVLMVPAVLETATEFLTKNNAGIMELKNFFYKKDLKYVSLQGIKTDYFNIDFHQYSRLIVALAALLALIVPNAHAIITELANNFVCANDYLQHGSQKQIIQGNMEHLVEYITEHEPDCEIHFHAYSFGSILALDYLYPYGTFPSDNTLTYCRAIITIGTPYEFVQSYYPEFYRDRKKLPGDTLQWINIYSTADALATNFRKDTNAGEAEFGVNGAANLPVNVNYEVSSVKGIADFIILYSIRVHEMYWDDSSEGQSCLGLIYREMRGKNLI